MIRAILDGRKTQTRRIVKGTALEWLAPGLFTPEYIALPGNHFCPYGYKGDRLWVREEHYQYGWWVTAGTTKTGRQKWSFIGDPNQLQFDPPASFRSGFRRSDPYTPAWYKRLARFMPKESYRIMLEVTEVRCERLQSITPTDAITEGIEPYTGHYPKGYYIQDSPNIDRFARLWDSINKDHPWESNCWVWVVSFRRIEP